MTESRHPCRTSCGPSGQLPSSRQNQSLFDRPRCETVLSYVTDRSGRRAIIAFDAAWHPALRDYRQHAINSEACLQGALYRALRNRLARVDDNFVVFLECLVRFRNESKPVYIDMLIVHCRKVVLAAELKYKPKGRPIDRDVSADLVKLGRFQCTGVDGQKLEIYLDRYDNDDTERLPVTIAPARRVVLASSISGSSTFKKERDLFWEHHRSAIGGAVWNEQQVFPPRLAVRLAITDRKGGVDKGEFRGRHHLVLAPARFP